MALPIAWAAVGAGSIAMSLLRRARRRAGEPSDAANPALSADTDDKPSPDSPSPSAVAETDGDRHDAPSSDGASETAGGEGSTLRRRRGKGEGGSEAGGRAGEGAGRAAEADSTRDERGPAERSAANGVANGATDDDAASAEESRAAQVEAAGADACGEGTNAGECGDGQATEDAAEGAEDETSVGEVVGERPDHAAEGGVAAGAAGAAEETSGAAANTGVGAGESKAQGKPEVATADEATPKAAQPAKAPQTKPRQQPLGVFVFWLVFITLTGLIAGIFLLAQFLFLQDAGHSDFISIPPLVRAHLDRGQTLKVAAPGAMVGGKSGHGQQEQVEVFVRAEGWGTGRGRRWGAEGRAGESGGGRAGDGQSKEVVVLLHGLGGSSFLYRDVITLLADKGLRAVAFDLPGSGLSTKLTSVEEGAAAVYPVHQLARTIDRVLSALGITEPVHLVLHDTGGVVGTLWAADNVPRVRSITLVDTPMEDPFAPAFPPPGSSATRISPRWLRALCSLWRPSLPPAASTLCRTTWHGPTRTCCRRMGAFMLPFWHASMAI
ncbi:hypothetical protein CLOM_g4077 [Closterium sp. NIES-68]|nr:hypothetical protein CLOM_g4077 [Closterium sp. NIES-68]